MGGHVPRRCVSRVHKVSSAAQHAQRLQRVHKSIFCRISHSTAMSYNCSACHAQTRRVQLHTAPAYRISIMICVLHDGNTARFRANIGSVGNHQSQLCAASLWLRHAGTMTRSGAAPCMMTTSCSSCWCWKGHRCGHCSCTADYVVRPISTVLRNNCCSHSYFWPAC